MTFTTTPPTTPGFYAWRLKPTHNSSVEKLHIDNTGTLRTREGFEPKSLAGEWCRLVPAEEVARAFYEGMEAYASGEKNPWNDSRAKQVAEGKI